MERIEFDKVNSTKTAARVLKATRAVEGDATVRSLSASHAPGWGAFDTMTGACHARMSLTRHGWRQAHSDRDNTGHGSEHEQSELGR